MKIWIDIVNVPHISLFRPILNRLKEFEYIITIREFSGIGKLLSQYGIQHLSIGSHYGGNNIAKFAGTCYRTLLLLKKLPKFDVSMASLNFFALLVGKFRSKRSVAFTDNDFDSLNLKVSVPFVDHLFVPSVFDNGILEKYHLCEKVCMYSGFKEDISIADYEIDPRFSSQIPFEDFIVIRPEALQAEYVFEGAKTIVPELLARFEREGCNVLYLPRYSEDKSYADGRKNVFIPPNPVNGLDACYHSNAVLTGSGTFAREAGIMGVPAVSFFPEKTLLSVDREMITRKWMIHSRDIDEIVDYVLTTKRRDFDRDRCKSVQTEVITQLRKILGEIENANA